MSKTVQRMLASRAAATMLALLLFAGITAPFLILQSTHAFAAAAPLPCTEGNHNGCTELSATPPEDIQSVPPNLVLMLDDSGSMGWDYMPDWDYLALDSNGNQPSNWNPNNAGVRAPAVNGVYYNPQTTYTPPPKADGTSYPNSPGIAQAFADGFTDTSIANRVDVTGYKGNPSDGSHKFPYYVGVPTTVVSKVFNPPTTSCPSGYSVDPNDPHKCISPLPKDPWIVCHSGDGYPKNHGGQPNQCKHVDKTGEGPTVTTWYDAFQQCQSGLSESGGMCYYPVRTPTYGCGPHLLIGGQCVGLKYIDVFTYFLQTSPLHYAQRLVASGTQCDILYNASQRAICVNEGDISGVSAPAGVAAGQNIANWFSYYHTRLLMAKSGLMTAFSNLDKNYRFGFASINGNGKAQITGPAYVAGLAYASPSPASAVPYATFDDSFSGGGDSFNRLAVVQPYGDGSDSTSQKAKFWSWIANESAANGTPLRKALDAVGQYYQTGQPWQTMPGDPGYTTGSTTQFACRASYTILTTDGFWNGNSPGGVGAAAGTPGPMQTVPSGNLTQYLAQPPFSGGAADSGASLADVATHYWENDLNTILANEVSASTADPASWQHMATFTIGLGFDPVGIQPAGTTVQQIFAWAQGGAAIPGFSWPTPSAANNGSVNNIADLAHAAVNGRGDFFNVKNPQELANAFAAAIADIGARNVAPKPAAVNASVLALGAVSLSTGYSTGDWSGSLWGVALKTDGTIGNVLWKAETKLDSMYHSSTAYTGRTVYTGAYKLVSGVGTLSTFQLEAANKTSLDTVETAGLQTPALAGGSDTLANRINYLLGDSTYEGSLYRRRSSILGAILHAEPVYVAGASGNYRDGWPTFGVLTPPEAATGAQTYATFVQNQATRAGMAYMGANDGMLHAFHAPVPTCTGTVDSDGNCSAYTFPVGSKQGEEAWAYVPRAVYANLGNLTNAANFHFRPSVDATPVTRDVFFGGDKKWHTLLTGSVGLGGRGVYALDITDPTTFSTSDVLWEFDADMPVAASCVATYDACRGTDLGYTVAQPNVARLANGKWVVLVPNGYFPDCGTPDTPTADAASCKAIADQAPRDASDKPYSALFVLDAQTGKMIAELKTPTNIPLADGSGTVTSFGLAKPVMGDYNSDQVDDVAFAGDVQGNLWRFDLSDTDPSNWKVSLVYEGLAVSGIQGVQPITTMPRLFPDPGSNRFLVLFGTGKYLGVGDNANNSEQSIYAVRDVAGTTYSQTDLTQQYLHESLAPATLPDGSPNPIAGASLRCITGGVNDNCSTSATAINSLPSTGGGWYIDLYTATSGVQNNKGERVVVNPAAIFASNTVVFESLITGSQGSDACNPSTQGALLALDATTGGPAGMSSLGGWPVAGGRISDARTSGSLPIVSALGGGRWYFPGGLLSGPAEPTVTGGDLPIARRRSWRVLMNDQ
ncbi:MAG: hypothetical protein EPN58_15885 [Rhodanobacter sp.]|nr:MAG: hypothetical protein EPN58_15885 [Rhodanobacter sp.]